jgi:hypothetical protein
MCVGVVCIYLSLVVFFQLLSMTYAYDLFVNVQRTPVHEVP